MKILRFLVLFTSIGILLGLLIYWREYSASAEVSLFHVLLWQVGIWTPWTISFMVFEKVIKKTHLVINPSGAKAQVEGGIIEGLCAALYGEITIKDGATEQSNFHDYRWMRMNEVPEIDIEFIKNDLPPRGLGEPPLPPAAPALVNAIFAASGQ
jgi:hypothetical protein